MPPTVPARDAAPEVSVVMPAHNESALLEHTLKDLVSALRERDLAFEVLVVENGSTDTTLADARSFAAQDAAVHALTRPTADYGEAMRMGVLAAIADRVPRAAHHRRARAAARAALDGARESMSGARFAAALSEHPVASHAIGEVAGEVMEQFGGDEPDLVVCFASPHFVGAMDDVAYALGNLLEPTVMLGVSAVAVAGGAR